MTISTLNIQTFTTFVNHCHLLLDPLRWPPLLPHSHIPHSIPTSSCFSSIHRDPLEHKLYATFLLSALQRGSRVTEFVVGGPKQAYKAWSDCLSGLLSHHSPRRLCSPATWASLLLAQSFHLLFLLSACSSLKYLSPPYKYVPDHSVKNALFESLQKTRFHSFLWLSIYAYPYLCIPIVSMHHISFSRSSASERLGCFRVLSIISSAAVNIGIHVSLSILVSWRCASCASYIPWTLRCSRLCSSDKMLAIFGTYLKIITCLSEVQI